MYYKHYMKREPRIPGIALVCMVLIMVGTAVYMFKKGNPLPAQQGITTSMSKTKIDRLDVVNVRDRSMTIFWRTEKPTTGSVIYGYDQTQLDQKAFDERDNTTKQAVRRNHVVQVKGLKPKTVIYFKVFADNELIGQSKELAFSAQTTGIIPTSSGLDPIYGDVIRQNSEPEKDAVVIVHIGESTPLLARTNRDGTFLFSLCCVLSSGNLNPLYPSKDDPVKIQIISEDGTEKTEEGLFADVQPLQEALVLDSTIAQLATSVEENSQPKVLAVSDSIERIKPVDIVFPKEGASIPGLRPLVRGVGEPGARVKGTFPEMGRLFQVIIDSKRNWLYQPSFSFTPGIHTLKVETTDTSGKSIQLTRAFTILKSGEAVLGEATPSGTITPVATASPTMEPTLPPTVEPTIVFATSTPAPPVSGTSILPITFVSLVLVVIGAGIILLF